MVREPQCLRVVVETVLLNHFSRPTRLVHQCLLMKEQHRGATETHSWSLSGGVVVAKDKVHEFPVFGGYAALLYFCIHSDQ